MKLLREILLEATEFKTLEKNKQALTPEEHKECMEKQAIWHKGVGGRPSPAVWKSIDPITKKTTYITNTHRAYNTAPTLKGAISRFHNFIKSTA